MPGEVKSALKSQALQEQGWLCAYTGKRIEPADRHLEHMMPFSVCRDEDAALRAGGKSERCQQSHYCNLVACSPREGGDRTHRFGAPWKAGVWPAGSLTPLCCTLVEREVFLLASRELACGWMGHYGGDPPAQLDALEPQRQAQSQPATRLEIGWNAPVAGCARARAFCEFFQRHT